MESIIFRIMNLNEFHKLLSEIEEMTDETEKEARLKLMEEIQEKITDYDVHVREYAYRQTIKDLIDRGIVIESADRKAVVTAWDDQFDRLVSAEVKKASEHYTNQFRWHIFSFELLFALQRDEARKAFDEMPKTELYLFFDYSEECYRIRNVHLLTAKDVEDLRKESSLGLSDMYFFDPVNKWTYIKTHEEYCGPYFCKVD